ncbi:MAG: hypothetical protein IKO61_03225 [Lachnospiraceae bacterium]|nr:hypothetical protein [Lachnospiraceae bacterium]
MAKETLRLELDEKGNVKKYNMTEKDIKTLTERKYAETAKAIAETMKKKGCDN